MSTLMPHTVDHTYMHMCGYTLYPQGVCMCACVYVLISLSLTHGKQRALLWDRVHCLPPSDLCKKHTYCKHTPFSSPRQGVGDSNQPVCRRRAVFQMTFMWLGAKTLQALRCWTQHHNEIAPSHLCVCEVIVLDNPACLFY